MVDGLPEIYHLGERVCVKHFDVNLLETIYEGKVYAL